MPKEFGRNQRVAQFIKEELSILVQREFPLSQFGMITLTNVDVSPDLGNANIFITVLGNNMLDSDDETAIEKAKAELVSELNEKKGRFRQELSSMLTSRGVPHIEFHYDESIERAQRLTDIINSVSHSDDETPS
jgi:ribosome-binding factor A